jgi:hypothetical protein
MKSTYIYRFFQHTWGIYVGLTAELIPKADFSKPALEVVPNIYLSIEVPNVVDVEKDYLILGIKWVGNELQDRLKDQLPIVLRIIDLDIDHNDYQPEGLTHALLGWIEKEIGITFSLPTPYFDKSRNFYVFDLPKFVS